MAELTAEEREALEDAAYCVLSERNDAWPVGGDAYALANSIGMTRAVEALIDRHVTAAVTKALNDAADAIDRLAVEVGSYDDDAETVMAVGTYQHAARIVRARAT